MAASFRSMATDRLKCAEGSLTTDAACCFPVFLIAMAMLLMLLLEAGNEETAVRAFTEGAVRCIEADAAFSYREEQEGNDGSEGLRKGVQIAAFTAAYALYLRSEGGEGPSAWVSDFRTGLTDTAGGGIRLDCITEADVRISTKVPVPKSPFGSVDSSRTVVFRPWRGESESLCARDASRVYVFPKRGERYHIAGCVTMKSGSVETVLTAALKRKYSACSICHPDKLPYGSGVYMFSELSTAYHRRECACISKRYESMTKSRAEEEGYTPCMHCCGGG